MTEIPTGRYETLSTGYIERHNLGVIELHLQAKRDEDGGLWTRVVEYRDDGAIVHEWLKSYVDSADTPENPTPNVPDRGVE